MCPGTSVLLDQLCGIGTDPYGPITSLLEPLANCGTRRALNGDYSSFSSHLSQGQSRDICPACLSRTSWSLTPSSHIGRDLLLDQRAGSQDTGVDSCEGTVERLTGSWHKACTALTKHCTIVLLLKPCQLPLHEAFIHLVAAWAPLPHVSCFVTAAPTASPKVTPAKPEPIGTRFERTCSPPAV